MAAREPPAVVNAIAGIVQAYDAGIRITRQIRARRPRAGRQAPKGRPPLDRLESSLQRGKNKIEQLFEFVKEGLEEGIELGDNREMHLAPSHFADYVKRPLSSP